MKKLALFSLISIILTGCYTQPFYYLRTSFTIPDRYEKIVRENSCGVKSISLTLRDPLWDEQEIPKAMERLTKQVYKEKLYINHIYVKQAGHGNLTITILASNIPTCHKDKVEFERHKYHMIREEKCDCRLCK